MNSIFVLIVNLLTGPILSHLAFSAVTTSNLMPNGLIKVCTVTFCCPNKCCFSVFLAPGLGLLNK